MVQHTDRKYINLLSSRLDNFQWKSANLATCRCPICGDSEKHRKKKRGYFYVKGDSFVFFCHNECGGHSIQNLLKRFDVRLYQQYKLEVFKDRKKQKPNDDIDLITKTNTSIRFNHSVYYTALKDLKKISQLPVNHPAKQYVDSRRIPAPYHSIFRWAPDFMHWVNHLIPEKFDKEVLKLDAGRIVIPYFDFDNHLFALTARAITDTKQGLRYILIIFDNKIPAVFGLNSIDLNKQVFGFEGPIDSIFIPNSIAFSGNFLALTSLKNYNKIVIVFDNEPRSKSAKDKIAHAIDLGYPVVIWPSWVEYKDINNMIQADWSPEYIQDLLRANVYEGIEAKIRLENWSVK